MEVTPYFLNAVVSAGAACAAVAHSFGATSSGFAHDEDLGATASIWAAVRLSPEDDGLQVGDATARRGRRGRMTENFILVVLLKVTMDRWIEWMCVCDDHSDRE